MKKFLESKVFLVIVCALVFTNIGAFADNILASSITYKENTTVEDAIDDLYTKASTYKNLSTTTDVTSNKLLNGIKAYNSNGTLVTGNIKTFTPASSYTPTSSEQTISTSGKYMDGDIKIGAIPSNYKELNGNATATASKILSGYSAFDNSGNLINGSVITDCVRDSVVVNSNISNTTGFRIELGFRPSYWYDYFPSVSNGDTWDSNRDNLIRSIPHANGTKMGASAYTNYFIIDDTSITIRNYGSGVVNTRMYYVACK